MQMGRHRNPVLNRTLGRALLTVALAASFGPECGIDRPQSLAAPIGDIAATPIPQTVSDIWISPRIIAAPQSGSASQFRRGWNITGPDLCRAMREAGFQTTNWRAASLRSQSYECNFLRFFQRDQMRPLKSAFIRVRGNARGEILDIRGMLVDPTTLADGNVDHDMMRMFEIVIEQTRWSDLRGVIPRIRQLQDTEHRGFGARFLFTREEEGRKRYSFSLSLDRDQKHETRTLTYFRRTDSFRDRSAN